MMLVGRSLTARQAIVLEPIDWSLLRLLRTLSNRSLRALEPCVERSEKRHKHHREKTLNTTRTVRTCPNLTTRRARKDLLSKWLWWDVVVRSTDTTMMRVGRHSQQQCVLARMLGRHFGVTYYGFPVHESGLVTASAWCWVADGECPKRLIGDNKIFIWIFFGIRHQPQNIASYVAFAR